jgi:hypothetical protein
MATQSFNYDHPVYLTPVIFSGLSGVGANGVTTKFAAYTAMKIKAVHGGPVIATTAAGSTPLLFSKTGTTTSTTTLTALTSASSAGFTNDLATEVTLSQGDQFWCTHGTDATAAVAFAIETLVIPLSNVTP